MLSHKKNAIADHLLFLTLSSLQVIEISGVSEHLLTECESSGKFAQCPRCKEAVLKVDLEGHLAKKSCSRKLCFWCSAFATK